MPMLQRSASPADIEIGARIRTLRSLHKISQAELGDRLGVSFQQVQKYEKGSNRVSGARLITIAKVLNTDVASIIGPATGGLGGGDAILRDFLTSREGIAITRAFEDLSPAMRGAVAQLATNLAAQCREQRTKASQRPAQARQGRH